MEGHESNILVKVQFYDSIVGYENLWALPLGGSHYRIENVPFFIYDIAFGDVVEASLTDTGVLRFSNVFARSTNRTLRARSDALITDSPRSSRIAASLEELGCRVEIHHDRLLAINVPVGVNLKRVTDLLANAGLDWEYGSPAGSNTE
ncbi:MAG TPA: DUF4265 domain-containing protein [Tepidisphaeraceae bacterium]|nr:DUF4265 domain-containing protein [Tepidisphaeraceae bacterium]